MTLFQRKYKIVTGITTEYKINPQNPKYFAKFVHDNIMCFGNTENEAIENLKKLYEDYKSKNKLHSPLAAQVLNSYVSTTKFHKYFEIGISRDFFELIGEDPNAQIDDEYTIKDFELSNEQIDLIKSNYGLNINDEDFLVDIFEKIHKSFS